MSARPRNQGVSESEHSDASSLRRNTRARDGSMRSRKEGKHREGSRAKAARRRECWKRTLLCALFSLGPVGTIISCFLLPKGQPEALVPADNSPGLALGPAGSAGITAGPARMVHLQLVGTERRARFVLDEHTLWENFLAGCRERLQVGRIRRVTDSSGEAILAVEDLVHGDRVMIYAEVLDGPFTPDADESAAEAAHGEAPVRDESAPTGRSESILFGNGAGRRIGSQPQVVSKQPDRALNSSDGVAGSRAIDAPVDLVDQGVSVGNELDAAADQEQAAQGLQAQTPGDAPRQLPRASVPQLLQKLSTLRPSNSEERRASTEQAKGGAAGLEQEQLRPLVPDVDAGGEPLVDGVPLADELLDPDQPQEKCGNRHPSYRVAMLIPWVNELPPWLSYFITTAKLSEYLVDYLVFHESLIPPQHLPSNVRFIDLGQSGLSQLFGIKMGEELGMPMRNASLLIRSMRFMLEKWPRLVAEYKPAFGSIFEQYLSDYSHWGYCDLDMIIGNIPLFLEQAELATQDIITYSFGDVDALYLRGQWTVHRNDRAVSLLWKGCPHLGDDLQKELLMKVAWVRRMESRGIKNYPKRFQSAEGCYSHRAAMAPGIRIKMAHKQFVGLTVPSDDQIYFVNGAVWQCPKSEAVDVALLHAHSQQPCAANLPGVQEALGAMLPLEVSADGGCGNWMPVEYRMCAVNMPEPPEREQNSVGFNTYLRDGKFFAQRFRSTLPVLDNGCKQGAFFHMQEWKKIWGYGTHGVDPLELALARKAPPTFTVTTEGITLLT